jgi:hypothetical protein
MQANQPLLSTLFKPAPKEETKDSVEILFESLNNVATMLIAAGARIETLESHVAFLLSQNEAYMKILNKAKSDATSETQAVADAIPE